jgi:hypothetical protein
MTAVIPQGEPPGESGHAGEVPEWRFVRSFPTSGTGRHR